MLGLFLSLVLCADPNESLKTRFHVETSIGVISWEKTMTAPNYFLTTDLSLRDGIWVRGKAVTKTMIFDKTMDPSAIRKDLESRKIGVNPRWKVEYVDFYTGDGKNQYVWVFNAEPVK
jgi:hypothetical protein